MPKKIDARIPQNKSLLHFDAEQKATGAEVTDFLPLKRLLPHALEHDPVLVTPPAEVVLFVRPRQLLGASSVVIACIALPGCDKLKHRNSTEAKLETKRQQAACASPSANDRLKNVIFDEAVSRRPVDRANLDTLADYSVARMENPVVKSWDQSLDITRCEGRFILEVPPGAQRGLAGARQLQADIQYTAQASADGAGLVYKETGADGIVSKLAAFNLGAVAYRPPPAIDPEQAEPNVAEPASVQEAQVPQPMPNAPKNQVDRNLPERPLRETQTSGANARVTEQARPRSEAPGAPSSGEQAVRSFYAALGAGNGAAAASHVIPEKRSSGPFSAGAISRFYGRLPEPLRLTSVTPRAGAYRVTYRYSAGRSHCSGVAIVRVTNRGGRSLISSIRSLSGC